jgi:hypothetical protein
MSSGIPLSTSVTPFDLCFSLITKATTRVSF